MPRRNSDFSVPKNPAQTIKRFLKEIKPYRKLLVVTIVFSALSVLLTVFGPMILGLMTTSATTSIREGKGIIWDEIVTLLVILISLYVVSAIISYVQTLILTRISARLTKSMREKVMDKISKLPVSYFDEVKIGDVMSRMTNDVDAVAGQLSQVINEIVTSVVTVVGILAMMLVISIP